MSNKTIKKRKSTILVILLLIFLIALIVGTALGIVNVLQKHKEYIAFVVTEQQSNSIIKNSNNNTLAFDSVYEFDINYIFAEGDKIKKTYDYSVSLTGCQKMTLIKDERPIQFNNLDLSEAFKLEKKEKSFSITTPPATKFFELIFSGYLDNNKNNIYLIDLCDFDYFSLNIVSYNKKDNISYKFHFKNKENENYGTEEILFNGTEITFTNNDEINYPVFEIIISENEILFDGSNE